MKSLDLKRKIKEKGGVDKLLIGLQKKGIRMSKASYFRKMRGETQFSRKEILGIADELDLECTEITEIFFNEVVS